ncbi:hypothetical protein GYMLUDRAFT_632467 [Collybiopsis luxurians FD-317 M1]|nr:hypothetical protein GYMLUDRAFT_632467 [Collybiopsis luxurians FD-317 M1]
MFSLHFCCQCPISPSAAFSLTTFHTSNCAWQETAQDITITGAFSLAAAAGAYLCYFILSHHLFLAWPSSLQCIKCSRSIFATRWPTHYCRYI